MTTESSPAAAFDASSLEHEEKRFLGKPIKVEHGKWAVMLRYELLRVPTIRPVSLAKNTCTSQAQSPGRLLEWAAAWPQRSWAVEGAGGLGHLLAQQLVAAGKRVLDVQPKLAARVRLLADEAVNKNDPNDARAVAVTALWSRC